MSKKNKRNQIGKKCQSCGYERSHKRYNGSYMCFYCLNMDNGGTPRDLTGRTLNFPFMEFDTVPEDLIPMEERNADNKLRGKTRHD